MFLIVRFEIFTAVTMKNAIFWDVALCRSCVNQHFGGMYCLQLQGRKICEQGASVSRGLQTESPVENTQLYKNIARGCFYPEDGGDMFLRNVGLRKIYTAPHPRRWHSSCFLFHIYMYRLYM
jgi:hypothetical protein